MKVKIKIDKVKDGGVFTSNNTIEISLPLSYWPTSQRGGFSMNAQDGQGSYFGPNQMFGGPKSGELVLFDNSKTNKPYYAFITSYTQDWVSRKGDLIFVCFRSEITDRIIEGIKVNPQPTEVVFKHMLPLLGFDKTVDLCCELAKNKIHNLINKF